MSCSDPDASRALLRACTALAYRTTAHLDRRHDPQVAADRLVQAWTRHNSAAAGQLTRDESPIEVLFSHRAPTTAPEAYPVPTAQPGPLRLLLHPRAPRTADHRRGRWRLRPDTRSPASNSATRTDSHCTWRPTTGPDRWRWWPPPGTAATAHSSCPCCNEYGSRGLFDRDASSLQNVKTPASSSQGPPRRHPQAPHPAVNHAHIRRACFAGIRPH